MASNWVIIPTKLDALAVDGVNEVLRSMAEVQRIDEGEGVFVSGLIAFFTHCVLEAYNRGKINLHPHKRISRSARFDYILEVGENEGIS